MYPRIYILSTAHLRIVTGLPLVVLGVLGLLLLLVHLILPLVGIGSVVGERLLDRMRNWRGSGQVIADGTETMLIGNVVHSHLLAVLIDVRVVALLHHRLILLAGVLQEALGALLDAIGALVLVLEVAVLVHLLLSLQDGNVLNVVMIVIVGSHSGDQNGTNGNELRVEGRKEKML